MAESFEAALDRWQKINRQLTKLKGEEVELRQQLFSAAFPKPKEGTNNFELADGRLLKADYKINRSIDEEQWRILRTELMAEGIAADDIVTWKPSLSVGTYKKLTPAIRKRVDAAVTSKPGLPSFKVE